MKDINISQQMPVARKNDIVVQELSGEILVYDLRQHKAHCLNQTAARVWSHCDGETNVASIAALLSKELHRAIDEDVVWLALKQIQKAALLENEVVVHTAKTNISRREVVRRLGSATALALPLVTSVVAPTAAQTATIPIACQSCVKNVDVNGVIQCPEVCATAVKGTCYNNNGCGKGGVIGTTCQTCAQCAASGTNNSWVAPGELNC